MARKKKNAAQNGAHREGERVIGQLFGSLENSETEDIESDIVRLGMQPLDASMEDAVELPKKSRFFFVLAVFVIIMAVIGCFSTVRFISNVMSELVDNTSLKNEFARFIFPVVVNDIAPFENTGDIPNTSKITCAVWNIIINKETEQYENETGMLIIPEYDVMASCRELFGSTVTLEHQSVGAAEMRFNYDESRHSYTAQREIRYLTYAPHIVRMNEVDGNYVLIVGYLPPTVAAVSGLSDISVSPDKYMEYTISRWDGVDTILSVRFSNYVPETSEQ